MALSFRRRRNIDPMPRHRLEIAMGGTRGAISGPSDDYLIEGDKEPARPSATVRVAQFLQIVLIALIAVLSLVVFWLVGTLLNIV